MSRRKRRRQQFERQAVPSGLVGQGSAAEYLVGEDEERQTGLDQAQRGRVGAERRRAVDLARAAEYRAVVLGEGPAPVTMSYAQAVEYVRRTDGVAYTVFPRRKRGPGGPQIVGADVCIVQRWDAEEDEPEADYVIRLEGGYFYDSDGDGEDAERAAVLGQAERAIYVAARCTVQDIPIDEAQVLLMVLAGEDEGTARFRRDFQWTDLAINQVFTEVGASTGK